MSSDRARRRTAGRHAQRTGNRLALRAQLLLALALGLAVATAAYAPDPLKPYGLIAAAALALLARRGGRVARRWQYGAVGERDVARALAQLPRRWTVLHDVDRGRGNVDHIAVGPRGLFTIETKLHRAGKGEFAQARGHAAWAARRAGCEATAVLCVARGDARPKQYAGVWVMGPRHLPRFLRRRRGSELDAAAVAERLLR